MDSLPFELHSQIFELACTDDGSTARSLSLVSRYVREASQPFLLQSLAVSGLSSLTELANKLDSLPPHRRHVRHLFLSDCTQKQAHQYQKQKGVQSDDDAMHRYDLERTTIVHILELVAPTLESLSFVVSCPFNSTELIGHMFSLTFPCLEDLSVHGFYPFPPAHLCTMPVLTRLHLSGNRNPHGLLQLGGLHAACPTLTHLRVSGLVGAVSFAEELERAVLPNHEPTKPSPFHPSSSSLPAGLTHITLHTGPSPPAPISTRRPASARAQHVKMSDRLEALAAQTLSVQLAIKEVEEGSVECEWYDGLRREWSSSFVVE